MKNILILMVTVLLTLPVIAQDESDDPKKVETLINIVRVSCLQTICKILYIP